jgi:hypothetical protein
MAIRLTAEDGRQSMQAHAACKGAEIYDKYGPNVGWGQLLRILDDREVVRYPCEVLFDAGALLPGECAHAQAKAENPEDGFTVYVHPSLVANPRDAVFLVLYQLVLVSYGPFANSDDAEAFGASALGISQDQYYARLCEIADRLPVSGGPSLHGTLGTEQSTH